MRGVFGVGFLKGEINKTMTNKELLYMSIDILVVHACFICENFVIRLLFVIEAFSKVISNWPIFLKVEIRFAAKTLLLYHLVDSVGA
jgi:hypothetical protein